MLPYYYSLNEYLLKTFNKKIYKLAINGGMTCPNRDGFIHNKGCIFCSAGGSGEFTGDKLDKRLMSNTSHNTKGINITGQIEAGMKLLADKYSGNSYIAYFQSFTNTYAPIAYLENVFTEAITHPNIQCLSIATRPDCINNEVCELLARLQMTYNKPIWIELGLQTIHTSTAAYIRRGYELNVFEEAMDNLKSTFNKYDLNINIIVHMIIGLPGETPEDMYETAKYLSRCNIDGIKLQLLHILKGTDLVTDYEKGLFEILTLEKYIEILGHIIELLPPDMVIHRITGDGPKKLLIAPLWSSNKKMVMNTINNYFRNNNIIQGSHFQPGKD